MLSINNFFNFNKRQEKGVFVLSTILIIVILISYFAPQLASDPPKYILENAKYLEQVKLQRAEAEIKKPKKYFNNKKTVKKDEAVNIKPTGLFDPNLISVKKLEEMGVSKYVATNIQKYRDSGGKFKKNEDLAKIYGMTDEMYQALKAFIDIPKKKVIPPSKPTDKKKTIVDVPRAVIQSDIMLGINSADSVQLLTVKGIGPYYAGEIVRYRKRLGGYNKLYQLNDLFKMDNEKYLIMKNQLFLDTVDLVKININKVKFKALLRHPYVDYETTKYIMNKRSKLGQYAALYQLKDNEKMPNYLYEKLLPYLSVD